MAKSCSWAGKCGCNKQRQHDFYLTGVQLEVGTDTATDFEHRTFADELRLDVKGIFIKRYEYATRY